MIACTKTIVQCEHLLEVFSFGTTKKLAGRHPETGFCIMLDTTGLRYNEALVLLSSLYRSSTVVIFGPEVLSQNKSHICLHVVGSPSISIVGSPKCLISKSDFQG